jgi:hypothetical protein
VRLDQQPVCSGRDRGKRHGSDVAAITRRVGRVENDR